MGAFYTTASGIFGKKKIYLVRKKEKGNLSTRWRKLAAQKGIKAKTFRKDCILEGKRGSERYEVDRSEQKVETRTHRGSVHQGSRRIAGRITEAAAKSQ